MSGSLSFHLNGKPVGADADSAPVTLDWLRRIVGLTGTKEGCREGDCGACLVLLGGPPAESVGAGPGGARDEIEWLAVPSCLLALAELDGRHIVTIEGLAADGPTPVMKALHGEGASQCGFCSPGIVVALTAFLLGPGPRDVGAALASVDGNLCRCTGYGSIRRAAAALAEEFSALPGEFAERLTVLAERGVIPPALAAEMATNHPALGSSVRTDASATGAGTRPPTMEVPTGGPRLGGGTDFFVRNPEPQDGFRPSYSDRDPALRRIVAEGSSLAIGAGVTDREFFASPLIRSAAPGIEAYERSVASAPIRARATLAGNIVNASPVADLTAMLIALGASLRLAGPAGRRELPLERLFLGYKKLDLGSDEVVETIVVPGAGGPAGAGARRFFSFEKASKRANLDIASVNCAISCRIEEGPSGTFLHSVRIAAGGVGPTPLYLAEASAALEGAPLEDGAPHAETVRRAAELAVGACAPQSDVRGSASYRSALVRRFVYAHCIRMAPDSGLAEVLFP